jgi:hypothetical protein
LQPSARCFSSSLAGHQSPHPFPTSRFQIQIQPPHQSSIQNPTPSLPITTNHAAFNFKFKSAITINQVVPSSQLQPVSFSAHYTISKPAINQTQSGSTLANFNHTFSANPKLTTMPNLCAHPFPKPANIQTTTHNSQTSP